MNQRIVCAANRHEDLIIASARHFDALMHNTIDALIDVVCASKWEQGFIDQRGNFLTRKEAYIVAKANNQIIRDIGYETDQLYSEHLY